jgi:hypothetical protein
VKVVLAKISDQKFYVQSSQYIFTPDIVVHYHTSWYYLSSNPSIFTPDMFEYYFHANDFLVYIYVERDEFSRNPSPHAININSAITSPSNASG